MVGTDTKRDVLDERMVSDLLKGSVYLLTGIAVLVYYWIYGRQWTRTRQWVNVLIGISFVFLGSTVLLDYEDNRTAMVVGVALFILVLSFVARDLFERMESKSWDWPKKE